MESLFIIVSLVAMSSVQGSPAQYSGDCDFDRCKRMSVMEPGDNVDAACGKLKRAKDCYERAPRTCLATYGHIYNRDLNHLNHRAKDTCGGMSLTGESFVQMGQPLRLVCNVTGAFAPAAYVRWYRNGILIDPAKTDRIAINTQVSAGTRATRSVLTAEESSNNDTGNYVCKSSDSYDRKLRVYVAEDLSSCKNVIACMVHIPQWKEGEIPRSASNCRNTTAAIACLQKSVESCKDQTMHTLAASVIQEIEGSPIQCPTPTPSPVKDGDEQGQGSNSVFFLSPAVTVPVILAASLTYLCQGW